MLKKIAKEKNHYRDLVLIVCIVYKGKENELSKRKQYLKFYCKGNKVLEAMFLV